MGTITVYREYGIPLVGRMKVFVDGILVTGLRSNSAVDITAGGGRHTVRVGLAWQASAPVDVDLEDGGRVTLRARVDLRAQSFTAFFLRPKEALDLDVVPGRPRIPEARTEQASIPPGLSDGRVGRCPLVGRSRTAPTLPNAARQGRLRRPVS